MAVVADQHPGLTSTEAARRLAERGESSGDASSRSLKSIVRENVFTLVNAIALGFLVLIVVAGAWADAIFAVIIVINTAIGISQEVMAKRKLDKLALLVAPRARVRRDGRSVEVTPEAIVSGDVVEIAAGDQVLADGRVLQATSLSVDESILTGEADHIGKLPGDELFSGAFVAAGSGLYEVEAVGADSFAAKLTSEARQTKRVLSPLQLQINSLLRRLLVAMIPLSAALLAALWLHDVAFQEGAQTATAGLISIVPEGLVLLASVTLAVAAVRISKTGAIVQQLNAVESLAGVDTVCLDKTGTLTDGTLELIEVVPVPGGTPGEAAHALARMVGASETRSTTSEAIAQALDTTGAPSARRELPFSSRWKWSGVDLGDTVFILGAPEVLGTGPLAEEIQRRQAERERVLVFGRADSLPEVPDGGLPILPPGFTVLGIVVLRERLRADAIEVVEFLRDEGVDLKVMSGDAPTTVEAVARAVGFADTTTISGADLPDDPVAFSEVAHRTSVFARVTPEQKQALVRALADQGRYVAMVGDGVNDVPAMKAARISIALGSGSQIAKGVSDIVLISGDYRAIPRGIAEGRRILSNIRRVAKLFVVKSAFAATLILTVGLAGSAYPLLPRHLSLAALFTVGIPSFALALAPSRGRPPGLDFVKDLLRFSVPGGFVSALAVLAAYGATKSLPDRTLEDARTVAVIVLVLTGLYLILLLEDEAIEESSQRALAVAVLMGTLLAGFVACFVLSSTRSFFELSVPDPVEILLALMATCFAIGALGLLGFRAPLVARRIFGDQAPPSIIPLGDRQPEKPARERPASEREPSERS